MTETSVLVSGFYLRVPAPCSWCSHMPAFWAVMWTQKCPAAAGSCALLLLRCFLMMPSRSLSSPWALRDNLEEGGLHLHGAGKCSLTPLQDACTAFSGLCTWQRNKLSFLNHCSLGFSDVLSKSAAVFILQKPFLWPGGWGPLDL